MVAPAIAGETFGEPIFSAAPQQCRADPGAGQWCRPRHRIGRRSCASPRRRRPCRPRGRIAGRHALGVADRAQAECAGHQGAAAAGIASPSASSSAGRNCAAPRRRSTSSRSTSPSARPKSRTRNTARSKISPTALERLLRRRPRRASADRRPYRRGRLRLFEPDPFGSPCLVAEATAGARVRHSVLRAGNGRLRRGLPARARRPTRTGTTAASRCAASTSSCSSAGRFLPH